MEFNLKYNEYTSELIEKFVNYSKSTSQPKVEEVIEIIKEIINEKVNDYVKSTFFHEVQKIFDIVNSFGEIEVIDEPEKRSIYFDNLRIHMKHDHFIDLHLFHGGKVTIEATTTPDVIGINSISELNKIIEKYCGIKKVIVRYSEYYEVSKN